MLANQVPYGNNSSNSGVALEPGDGVNKESVSTYIVGESALEVMGLRLLEGAGLHATGVSAAVQGRV